MPKVISSRFTWKYFFGDPGFYANVSRDFSIYEYLQEKLIWGFDHIKASDSPFLNILFFGNFKADGALPPHLQKENYQTLKSHLDNISIVTASLTDYLWQQPQDSYDKYSLSDFSSYTNPDKYERIWKGIIKTSRNGALVCERQFLVKRQLPLEVRAFVERDEGVEKKLESYDNSIFYSFVIARIYE
jgi:S-adenosylmethionine-diacylglycerol 3-amino-3-carboxypropyl transferase